MDWPKVSVMIITFMRLKEIKRTIYALLKHLDYDKDKLLWHIADDGTPDKFYIPEIEKEFPYLRFTKTVTARQGWGKNCNVGLQNCFERTKFCLQLENDYEAIRTIPLKKAVAVLMSTEDSHRPDAATKRGKIACVRLDGIEGHWLSLQQRQAKTPIGPIDYCHILKSSPFLNCYSHHPMLKTPRFHQVYGPYLENAKLARTETEFANRFKHSKKGPWIVCLSDGIDKSFLHFGKSMQDSEYDEPQQG